MERAGVVRVDAEPGGKKFQGVWLELPDGQRWVIAYRAWELWRQFEDLAVAVEGEVYEPLGQAINATHLRIGTIRAVDPGQARRYLAVGPERAVSGVVIALGGDDDEEAASGPEKIPQKSRKDPGLLQFRESSGRLAWVAGSADALPVARPLQAWLRPVTISPTWAATPDGDFVWIAATRVHPVEM